MWPVVVVFEAQSVSRSQFVLVEADHLSRGSLGVIR